MNFYVLGSECMQENNIVITTDSKNEVIIDNDKKSYNYFLYQERIKLNLKRRKFAKHLKIRPLRYSFIERGYFKPKKKEIKKISNYLGIDYSIYMEGYLVILLNYLKNKKQN